MTEECESLWSRVALAFLAVYWDDRSNGRFLDVDHYVSLFPEHAGIIAEEYARQPRPDESPVTEHGTHTTGLDADTIGPYSLLEEIGSGGQGTVYLAEDRRLRRLVALKILREGSGLHTNDRVRRFRREALAASRLDHPSICPVYDVGVHDGRPFMAMKHIDGRSLADLLSCQRESLSRKPGPVQLPAPPAEPADGSVDGGLDRNPRFARPAMLMERLARALHAAHEAGIIHRDVKPGNVMLLDDGQPMLLDFGLARIEDDTQPDLTRTGEIHGTPAYMSPEQVRQERPITRRSDIYSLGVTFFECLTGRRPFERPTRTGLQQAILKEPFPRLRSLVPGAPRDLDVILETAVQKNPSHRYETAEALADDLRAWRTGGCLSVRPVSRVTRVARWVRREPLKAVTAALALLLAASSGYLVARWPDIRLGEARRASIVLETDLEQGYYELGEGASTKAMARFSHALSLDRSCLEAAAGLALVHLRSGDPAAALVVLRAPDVRSAREPALELMEADALKKLGRDTEAARLGEGVSNPKGAMGWFLMAMREIRRGEAGHAKAFRSALNHLSRAILNSSGARALYLFERAHAAGHCGDEQACDDTARVLIDRWPSSALAQYWAGFAWRQSRPARSLQALDRAIAMEPDNPRFHAQRGTTLTGLRRYEDAISSFQTALSLNPDSGHALRGLGYALMKTGRKKRAQAVLERALEQQSGNAFALYTLGVVRASLRDLIGARSAFERAIEADPLMFRAHDNLGVVLKRQGKPRAAVRHHREAVRLAPARALGHANLGVALAESGDVSSAVASYRRALRLDRRLWLTHYNLGNALVMLGKPHEALKAYGECTRQKPSFLTARYQLARTLYKLGRLQEAVTALKGVLESDAKFAPAHYLMGLTLRDLGEFAEALAHLRTSDALGASPSWWRQSASKQVARAEDMKRLAASLDDVSSTTPSGMPADMRLGLAEVAARTGRDGLALRLFQEAFSLDPSLADRDCAALRLEAALVAARVGLEAEGRSQAGARCLGWLQECLDCWARSIAAGGREAAAARELVLRALEAGPLEDLADRIGKSGHRESAAWLVLRRSLRALSPE